MQKFREVPQKLGNPKQKRAEGMAQLPSCGFIRAWAPGFRGLSQRFLQTGLPRFFTGKAERGVAPFSGI